MVTVAAHDATRLRPSEATRYTWIARDRDSDSRKETPLFVVQSEIKSQNAKNARTQAAYQLVPRVRAGIREGL
jgi:hypothetical protein